MRRWRAFWMALVLGAIATMLALPIAVMLESAGAPAVLVALFAAPFQIAEWLGATQERFHSSGFILATLAGFGVTTVLWAAGLLPLARWFSRD